MEIYQESITDLLSPSKEKEMHAIREDQNGLISNTPMEEKVIREEQMVRVRVLTVIYFFVEVLRQYFLNFQLCR